MPYALDPLDQQKQQQQQGQAPAMTSGGMSFGAGSPTAAGPKSAQGAQKQGSGFVNLGQYMQANKGSGFGQQVAGQVKQGVESAGQQLQQGAQQFGEASNKGRTRWGDVQGEVQGALAGAGDKTSDEQVKRIQDYAKAQYQGPESFGQSAYGAGAMGAVNKAGQEAKAFQSEGGRFALLDQYYGRPKYTQGQKTLDNLLLQNAPGAGARAQAIGNQAKQLQSQAGQTEQQMANLAAQNRQATADTAAQTRGAVKGAQDQFSQDLNKRYQDFQAQQAKNYADLQKQYGSGALSQKAFEMMGVAPTAHSDYLASFRQQHPDTANMSDDQLQTILQSLGQVDPTSTMGLDLNTYLQQGQQTNLGQFASDQDYARSLALQKIAGDEGGPLSAQDRALAGSAEKLASPAFNKEAYQRDLAERKAAYQQAANGLMGRAFSENIGDDQWNALFNQYGLNKKLSLAQ